MRVKLARGDLAAEPYHRCHRGGRCDLPPRPDTKSETRCHWTLHYTGTNVCACSMCSDKDGRRRDRRRDRHRTRRLLHTRPATTDD